MITETLATLGTVVAVPMLGGFLLNSALQRLEDNAADNAADNATAVTGRHAMPRSTDATTQSIRVADLIADNPNQRYYPQPAQASVRS